jgi:hypothetical protein
VKQCKYFLLIGVLLSYFISDYLPVEWGWENSLLEWLQVAILVVGLILNYTWWQEAKSMDKNTNNARFLLWTIPLWLLIIARELSWGRVFYPRGFDAVAGPSFLPLSQLPYGPIVYPLLTIIIVVWLYMVVKYRLYKIPYELLKGHRFPVADLIITAFAFIDADIGEHKFQLQNMEEFDECLAYLGLILVAYYVQKALRKEAENVVRESKDSSLDSNAKFL